MTWLSKPILLVLSLSAHLALALPTEFALTLHSSDTKHAIAYNNPDDVHRCMGKPQSSNGCNCCPPNTHCISDGGVQCSVWPHAENELNLNEITTEDGMNTAMEHDTHGNAKEIPLIHNRDLSILPAESPSQAVSVSTVDLVGALVGSIASPSTIHSLGPNGSKFVSYNGRTLRPIPCKRRPADVWESLKPELAFPTVETLLADIKTCGTIGNNTIFQTVESTQNFYEWSDFPDSSFTDGYGILDTHGMEEDFHLMVLVRYIGRCRERLPSYMDRFFEAVARASSGNAYVTGDNVIPGRTYDRSGDAWLNVEFPALQRNAAIQKVFKVLLKKKSSSKSAATFKVSTIWTRDVNPASLPYNNASLSELPLCRSALWD